MKYPLASSRNALLAFKTTKREAQFLRDEAKRKGLSLSAYIHGRVFGPNDDLIDIERDNE